MTSLKNGNRSAISLEELPLIALCHDSASVTIAFVSLVHTFRAPYILIGKSFAKVIFLGKLLPAKRCFAHCNVVSRKHVWPKTRQQYE